MDRTNADVVRDLTVQVVGHQQIDGSHFILTPPGCSVQSLEQFQEAPSRTRSMLTFVSLDSAIAYINRFKDEGSQVFLKKGGVFDAVLDYSKPDAPRWGHHVAKFLPKDSDRWQVWQGANRRNMSQRDFALFVEDNVGDFLAPSGGEMLDIARTLEAKKGVNFKSGIRLENGDVSLAYEETTVAKAGVKGELEVPSQFTINVPVLQGDSPRAVECRLRYEIREGALVFTVEIIRLAYLLELVTREIAATVKNETGLEPLMVA